jgi:hypothetical protein
MACDVIFTKTGTDEKSVTVTGSGINIEAQTEVNLLLAIRMNLKQAIVDMCGQLDADDVETTAMTNQKTLLQTALTSSGWWYAILILCLLCLFSTTSWAGSLYPTHDAVLNLNSGSGVNGGTTISCASSSNQQTGLGIVDSSGSYWVTAWANVYAANNSMTTGVSIYVYSYATSSGVTNMNSPIAIKEVDPTTYALLKETGISGVTIPLGTYELQKYVGFAAGKTTAADLFSVVIRYVLGRGVY